MPTDTTAQLYDAIRTRLLTFAPADGTDTLAASLAGGLAFVVPPDNAPTPYAAIRLTDVRHRRSQRGRLTVEVEALFIHRPRSNARALERLVDVADQAMLGWTDATGGLIACTGHRRQTLPPFRESDDPELVQIRVLYDLIVWPSYLTQYLTPAP